MYLLLFSAWAQLLGFKHLNTAYYWNNIILRDGNGAAMTDTEAEAWRLLSSQNPSTVFAYGDAIEVSNALNLAHIMTHASMILIFVFVITFFVFLFRLISGMLAGRR